MSQSEALDELFAALSAAQGKMHGAKKDRDNPHFKAKFAGLSATWDACREALSENGLAVVQTVEPTADGNFLVTTLGHKSGQWIRGEVPLIMDRDGMQPLGSAITYARRYGLQAVTGIAPVDDDDAEGATDHEKKPDIIGQLNKTALKEKMRAFDRDLHRTTNDAEIDRVLEDYAEVLDQCKRELPGWWRSDPNRDFKGPPDRIETQRQAVRGMEPPPPDPLPNPEAEREGPQEPRGLPESDEPAWGTFVKGAEDLMSKAEDWGAIVAFGKQNEQHIKSLPEKAVKRLTAAKQAAKARLEPPK